MKKKILKCFLYVFLAIVIWYLIFTYTRTRVRPEAMSSEARQEEVMLDAEG